MHINHTVPQSDKYINIPTTNTMKHLTQNYISIENFNFEKKIRNKYNSKIQPTSQIINYITRKYHKRLKRNRWRSEKHVCFSSQQTCVQP